MPNYKCNRCLKEFDQKCHYEKHINKKFSCKIPAAKCSKVAAKCSKNEESNDNAIKCNYCGREFTRVSSLNVHIKDRCKVKKENDNKMEEIMTILIELKGKMTKLEEENAKYKGIINNTQNNNSHNIATQNNITFKINAYGQEDTSKITLNDYKRILGRGMNSVPVFVEKLHFDKNLPENNNVYISNLRDEYVLMYDGKIWRLKNRDDALQQLYEDKADILETKFEELIERLDEPTIKMFNRFLKIKDDDEEKIKIIKKELKKTLYDNRKIVMATRKKEDNLLTD
jgi:hypothetical protein